MQYFDVTQVLSLHGEVSENLQKLELPLYGPFADAVTLSRPGGTISTRVAAILVLSSPGLLHLYDGAGIVAHFFNPPEDSMKQAYVQPLPWQAPLKDVAFVKLFMVSPDSLSARVLLQVSMDTRNILMVCCLRCCNNILISWYSIESHRLRRLQRLMPRPASDKVFHD